MADNAARFDPELSEEDELFLMANLYPRDTGLPMTIWISPRGGARHDVRVKVSPVHGNRMELEDAAVMSVRPEPKLLHGTLSSVDETAVAAWIGLNEAVVLDYWNGDTSTLELAQRLKRI